MNITKESFQALPKETQDAVFEEMCELYNFVLKYPITVRDLQIFAEWINTTGVHGRELKEFLYNRTRR